ncbi:MAG TPA: hypothetical protein VH025_02875 [Solirubrobacteraceae bacterium]|jgi:hypothetical protein|nr:hypothetical protein [Solirubrobacteraceae bacterium]
MSPDRDMRADLEPEDADELIVLAERLNRERAIPTAAFRGELRRRLLAASGAHKRPARLRLLITSYAGGGAVLLLAGAASAAGIGPLGT